MAARRTPAYPSPFLAGLAGLVLIVVVLFFGKPVLVPLALAFLLTFILSPIVLAVQGWGLPRVPAVLLVVLFTFATLGLVGWGVGAQMRHLALEIPTHTQEIKSKIAGLRGDGDGVISRLMQMFEEVSADVAQPAPRPAETAPKGKVAAADVGDRTVIVTETDRRQGLESVLAIVVPVLEPLATAGLIVVLVVFMLVKREDLRNRFIGVVGHGHLTGTTRVLDDAAQRLSRFLLTQLIVNCAFGFVFGLGLLALGVSFPFLWAFLMAIMRFVPYIGSWIAVGFPLLLSFAMAPTWTQPVLVLVLFAVLDLVTANVIEPLVFGHSTGVTPIALLVAAAFWTWIWGPIGLLLSTPLTLCLVVLGQHVPRLRFLAVLLGDTPALPRYATYYQRLLAHDRAEATLLAKTAIETHGLARGLDEVVLPALALARRDRRHGGLTAEEDEEIHETTAAILNGFATADAGEHRQRPVTILGCPAQDEAEEITLRMLDQVLAGDGIAVEVESTRALPTEVETRIRQERPALVFIAMLPPGGVDQVRYLCRRLRRRFPDLPIVVGSWGKPEKYDRLLVLLRSAGASYVTTSLEQSRNRILALVRPAAPSASSAPAAQPTGASA